MENKELVHINYEQLPAFKDAIENQKQLVVDNPFIEITDSKTYQAAKKHRTALKTGRTELQNGEKTIASKLREFRKIVENKTLELVRITKSAEVKQQNEITRYELVKQQEKEAAEKAETERLDELRLTIKSFYLTRKILIDNSTIASIDSIILEIENNNDDLHDFQNDFLIKKSELISSAKSKKNQLVESEKLRLEKIEAEKERTKLEAEKKAFEEKKKADEEKKAKEEKIKKQSQSAILAIGMLNLVDSLIINMTKSEQSKEMSIELEKAIEGDFGIENDKVAKNYKILKEKLTKKKADLLEIEEKEKAEQAKEAKQRNELGKQRQEQLETIEVVKSIDECLTFTEKAYFEFFKEESEKFRIAQEKEESSNRRMSEIEPYLEFIEDVEKVLSMEVAEYNNQFKYFQKCLKDKKDKFIIEQKEKEIEEKKQEELNKSDLDKVNDLLNDIEALKTKYTFSSLKYNHKYEGVRQVLNECIEYINK